MPPARSIFAKLAGPLLVIGVAVGMAIWTWDTWPDVLVDFGKELYIAWRLSAGDHLYRDVAYYMGPLSPTINGLLFAVFGVGLRTLVIANLCVAGGIAGLLMHLAKAAAGSLAAVIAGLVFVLLFAFTQYTPTGNYNFVCPYEHEYTHGMLISLATLAVLWQAMTTRRTRWMLLTGVGCGLVALTRAELLIAIGAAVVTGAMLTRTRRTGWIALVIGGVLPPVVALLLLTISIGLHAAITGVAGSWPSMFNTRLTSLPFYRQGMGLLDPARSLRLLAVGSLQWVIWLLPAMAVALLIRPAGRSPVVRTIVMAGLVLYGLAALVFWKSFASTDFFRPLTLSAIVWTLCAIRSWWKQRSELAAFRLALTVFAGLLLLKMVLYARIHQYGFAVAMPATIITAVALGVLLPNLLDAHGLCGAVLRAAMLATGLAVVAVYLMLSAAVMKTKTVKIAVGTDTFWTDKTRGPAVNQCLADLARLPASSTVLVVPEGAMLNYLSRRAEPTPFANFNPPDLAIFGEDQVLRAIEAHPPDVIVIAHKDTIEFGVRFFGRDYGQPIFAWIRSRYTATRVMGAVPLREPKKFGIAEMTPNLRQR